MLDAAGEDCVGDAASVATLDRDSRFFHELGCFLLAVASRCARVSFEQRRWWRLLCCDCDQIIRLDARRHGSARDRARS